MLRNISRILPFFIVTLLSIGAVELLYGLAERYLLEPQRKAPVETAMVEQAQQPAADLVKHRNYDIILERNLFQSFRKEEATATPAAEENPLMGLEETSLDLVLLGTIAGPADQSRAIIFDKKKNEQDLYYQGDVVEGAEIKEILRGKVILNYQGKDEILDMSEASKVRSNASAAGPDFNREMTVGPTMSAPQRRIAPPNMRSREDQFEGMSPEEMTEEFIEAEQGIIEEPVFEEPVMEEPVIEEPFFEEEVPEDSLPPQEVGLEPVESFPGEVQQEAPQAPVPEDQGEGQQIPPEPDGSGGAY